MGYTRPEGMKTLGVMISPEMEQAIHSNAKMMGVPKGLLAREILSAWLTRWSLKCASVGEISNTIKS